MQFDRRKFLEAIAMVSTGLAAGTLAGSAGAAPEPVWVPVPIPPQVPAQDGMVDVGGSRLW
jgi:hypothetical protein